MPNLAYIDGTFLPLAEAKVSIEDRGYQFGDGIYEVIRTYRGKPFQLAAHLDRLATSARALSFELPRSLADLTTIIEDGVRRAAHPDTKIYLQVSRGVAPRDHAFPKGAVPTLVLTFTALMPLDPARQSTGVSAIFTDDLRWARCDIKSLNLLGNVLARQRALDAGAFEALLVRQGQVTEGSVSNVVIVENGALATTPLGPTILAGVTRQVVLDLARRNGIAVHETSLPMERVRHAQEVFLTGTTVEVLPIVRIDGRPVGAGVPGPVTQQLQNLFRTFTQAGS
ncbi:MAG: D-amino-acid transaminase [Nitrospiraceae bacterium]